MIAGLACFITGTVTFASITSGLVSGFGSGLGKLILGASSFATSGGLGGSIFGGGVIFTFTGSGGLVGKINCVCSNWCCWIAFFAVIPMYRMMARMVRFTSALVANEAGLLSGSGSKPKLARIG